VLRDNKIIEKLKMAATYELAITQSPFGYKLIHEISNGRRATSK
jgi:hypothetical protein